MASFNLQDYETVESRLSRFWGDHVEGRILTELVSASPDRFIVRAEVYFDRTDTRPVSTGFAEEVVSNRGVNQTSALENCETSAIGRALANCGYAPKGARPSREEMSKVARAQEGKVIAPTAHDQLNVELQQFSKNAAERKAFVLTALGVETIGSLKELSDEQVSLVLTKLKQGTAPFTE